MIKISKPSKMKITGKKVGCWSLEARESCPGSVTDTGEIVEVCKGCYATKGMYRFPVVKNARAVNKADYMEDDWISRMSLEVAKYDYFRWFDSGDIETPELARKIRAVVSRTSAVSHWIPTRSDKIPEIRVELDGFIAPHTHVSAFDNVSFRPSADHIGFKEERPGVLSYVIEQKDLFEAKKRGVFICPVTLPGSTQSSCDHCTHCYGKEPVAYMLH